jgi:glyoxylase-like metal-dependent hydrolase (beta-lactamase superfamily II)
MASDEEEFMASVPASSYVASRAIGKATVSVISDGLGRSTVIKQLTVPEPEWRAAVPEADAAGEIAIGDASILIDLGFDDPPGSQWGPPRHQRSPGVEAGLATLGVTPEAITHVLITHSHGDHIAGGAVPDGAGGWRPRFPNARHLIGRADWEDSPARQQPDSLLNRHLGPVAESGLLDLIDHDTSVVPGVTLVPAPGESPGHCLVQVQSGSDDFWFLGDLFHHPCEVAHLSWVSQGRDQAAMLASRQKLVAAALVSDALLVASHIPFPGFGQVKETSAGLRWASL